MAGTSVKVRDSNSLRALCNIQNPGVVCMRDRVEWLSSDIADEECAIDGYKCVRLDRNRHGGGVVIYVHDSLEVHVLLRAPIDLEFVLVSVGNVHCKIFIGLLEFPCIWSGLLAASLAEQVNESYGVMRMLTFRKHADWLMRQIGIGCMTCLMLMSPGMNGRKRSWPLWTNASLRQVFPLDVISHGWQQISGALWGSEISLIAKLKGLGWEGIWTNTKQREIWL